MSRVPPNDLLIEQLSPPTDTQSPQPQTARGDRIRVRYKGTLFSTGARFDPSSDTADPFEFTLGVGQVIRGWDEGLLGMGVGEKRKLTIPANKAYGDRGFTTEIPPNSALVFEVELVSIARNRA